jgi:hypothetical protein
VAPRVFGNEDGAKCPAEQGSSKLVTNRGEFRTAAVKWMSMYEGWNF